MPTSRMSTIGSIPFPRHAASNDASMPIETGALRTTSSMTDRFPRGTARAYPACYAEGMTRRRLLAYLGVAVGFYLALCVAARLWYPRVLFPAPRVDHAPTAVEARLLSFHQDDGG